MMKTLARTAGLVVLMLIVAGCVRGYWQPRYWTPGDSLLWREADLPVSAEIVRARFEEDFYACGGPPLGTPLMLSGVVPLALPIEGTLEYARQTRMAGCLTARGWRRIEGPGGQVEPMYCPYPFETNCPRAAKAAGYMVPNLNSTEHPPRALESGGGLPD